MPISGFKDMNPALELKENKAAIEAIAAEFGVTQVRVFGSVARGTSRDNSDLDLLVKFERGRTLIDLVAFEERLTELLGVTVDVVVEGGVHPALEEYILREARAI